MSDTTFSYLTPEAQARCEIDEMLEAAGWSVQDADKVNLSARQGVGRFPQEWLERAFSTETERAAVRAFHHLGDVEDTLQHFDDFFEERRMKLAAVVRQRLGVAPPE
jgi:inorganic triphosphatase YgiF